jgi:hypothetical protein
MSAARTNAIFAEVCERLGVDQSEAGKPGLLLEHAAGGQIVRQVLDDGRRVDIFGSKVRNRDGIEETLEFALRMLRFQEQAKPAPKAKAKAKPAPKPKATAKRPPARVKGSGGRKTKPADKRPAARKAKSNG